MFTSVGCIIGCCRDDDNDGNDGSSTPPHLRPLLDRDTPTPSMDRRRPKTYGSKKAAGSSAAAVIFGSTVGSSLQRPPSPAPRVPLADVTAAIVNLNLGERDNGENDELNQNDALVDVSLASDDSKVDDRNESQQRDETNAPEDLDDSPDSLSLKPLTKAYFTDRGQQLPILQWAEILQPNSTVVKIAEASYAEVYRVSFDGSDSVIKIMQLRVPSDSKSLECATAIQIEHVVSEMRIMNALAVVPGFVQFKDAHLVRGIPCNSIVEAYNDSLFLSLSHSSFPHPSTYTVNSMFLAIELGDAGNVLEDCTIDDIYQLWDVILGLIMALSRAEILYEFEHRDLHENNICISYGTASTPRNSESSVKFGSSGLHVTLLDYGLSRAKLENGEIAFNDLENDLGLFHGSSGNSQFDTYRRMRTHLLTGEHKTFPADWHTYESHPTKNNGHTWEEFTPYTNVLWIKYIFQWLLKNYSKAGGSAQDREKFDVETKELKRRLDTRTRVLNGAFESAEQVLIYVVAQGWVNEEQLESYGVDSSILSEQSRLE